MRSGEFERKLSAVLSADGVGYSRLMGDDEDHTIRTLTGHRAMMSAIIEAHKGRVVDMPGDNVLAEFASVQMAVLCAVEIQRGLYARNAGLANDRRMAFRIGINVGDIAWDGERIYGDGVNLAARLEAMAEPGGICISGIVYAQVKNKLKLDYEFLGKQAVKNMREPVPVYRIKSLPAAAIQDSARCFSRYRKAPSKLQPRLLIRSKLCPRGLWTSHDRMTYAHFLGRMPSFLIG